MDIKFLKNSMLALFVISIALSCQPKKTENEVRESEVQYQDLPAEKRGEMLLYDEIIKIHDEVMPKLDDVMSLRGQLQEKLDASKESEGNEEFAGQLGSSIEELMKADESMMQWMRGFKSKEDETNHEEVMEYYTEQKKQIEEVKIKMNKAIDQAEVILKEE